MTVEELLRDALHQHRDDRYLPDVDAMSARLAHHDRMIVARRSAVAAAGVGVIAAVGIVTSRDGEQQVEVTRTPAPTTTAAEHPCDASVPGYHIVTSDGGVFVVRDVDCGPLEGEPVSAARMSSGGGHWLVDAGGTVTAFGDARVHEPSSDETLAAPAVDIAATPTGEGYWVVDRDGRVAAYGDARGFGSAAGALDLRSPVVAIVAAPDGGGYWILDADGEIFAFAGTRFYGSTGGQSDVGPMVDMAATPSGNGYWLLDQAGQVFAFGDAEDFGSAPPESTSPIVRMQATVAGDGYWLAAADGTVMAFGNAEPLVPPAPSADASIVAILYVIL